MKFSFPWFGGAFLKANCSVLASATGSGIISSDSQLLHPTRETRHETSRRISSLGRLGTLRPSHRNRSARYDRYAPLEPTRRERQARGIRLRRRPVGRGPRRQEPTPAHHRSGTRVAPVFSPDGQIIAFSAQYDGNTDVYTIPVAGGIPTRLTWHPVADIVRGFTPDGKKVLFSSNRNVYSNRHIQLFTVPLTGGMPTQLADPLGLRGCLFARR